MVVLHALGSGEGAICLVILRTRTDIGRLLVPAPIATRQSIMYIDRRAQSCRTERLACLFRRVPVAGRLFRRPRAFSGSSMSPCSKIAASRQASQHRCGEVIHEAMLPNLFTQNVFFDLFETSCCMFL